MKFNIQTVMLLIQILDGLFIAVGLFLLFSHVFSLPRFDQSQNVRGLAKKVVEGHDFFAIVVDRLAGFLKRFVRINTFKKRRLDSQFEQLGLNMTPEEFYAKIAAKTLLFTIVVAVGFLVHIALGVILLALDVLFFLMQYNEIDKVVQKKKEEVESELPKFVSVIEQTFKNDHDVMKLMVNYTESVDSPLSRELMRTLADMKTGDFDTALDRLANRVDSVFLSEVVRGLKSALRGENTIEYFITLNTKIWDHEKAVIKKKALKRPGRVKILTKVLLVCMFLIYIVVFATVIYEGLYEIFTLM